MELARRASVLTGGENPMALHTLAAALAEAGEFPEATRTAEAGPRSGKCAIEHFSRGGPSIRNYALPCRASPSTRLKENKNGGRIAPAVS